MDHLLSAVKIKIYSNLICTSRFTDLPISQKLTLMNPLMWCYAQRRIFFVTLSFQFLFFHNFRSKQLISHSWTHWKGLDPKIVFSRVFILKCYLNVPRGMTTSNASTDVTFIELLLVCMSLFTDEVQFS
jgi:hypothetical protein